jgi:hypothetical protein
MFALLAADRIGGDDLSLLFILLALLCFGGAAYLAYVRNIVGAIVLVFIAVVILLVGT